MFSETAYFVVLIAVVGFLAGAIASVSGFGIGSLLTPLLAVRVGTKLAVAVTNFIARSISACPWSRGKTLAEGDQ